MGKDVPQSCQDRVLNSPEGKCGTIIPPWHLHGDQGLTARIPGAGWAHSERHFELVTKEVSQKCTHAENPVADPYSPPFPTLFKLPVKICLRGKKVRNGSALDSPLKGTKAPNRLLFIAPAYTLM